MPVPAAMVTRIPAMAVRMLTKTLGAAWSFHVDLGTLLEVPITATAQTEQAMTPRRGPTPDHGNCCQKVGRGFPCAGFANKLPSEPLVRTTTLTPFSCSAAVEVRCCCTCSSSSWTSLVVPAMMKVKDLIELVWHDSKRVTENMLPDVVDKIWEGCSSTSMNAARGDPLLWCCQCIIPRSFAAISSEPVLGTIRRVWSETLEPHRLLEPYIVLARCLVFREVLQCYRSIGKFES